MSLYGAGPQKDVICQRVKAIPELPVQFSNAYFGHSLLCKCKCSFRVGVQKIWGDLDLL